MSHRMSRTLHALVDITCPLSEALVLSMRLGQCPVRSSRISTVPKWRFHNRIKRASLSHGLIKQRAPAQCFAVTISEEPSHHAVAMAERIVRRPRQHCVTYRCVMCNALSKRKLNADSGSSLNFWKSMLKKAYGARSAS